MRQIALLLLLLLGVTISASSHSVSKVDTSDCVVWIYDIPSSSFLLGHAIVCDSETEYGVASKVRFTYLYVAGKLHANTADCWSLCRGLGFYPGFFLL